MNSEWGVCFGENSKEVEIQIGRMKREKETIYERIQDIPPNPKEPWDLEMDYDDSLTPQIPTEQAPEEFATEQAPQEIPKAQAPEAFPMEIQLPPHSVVTPSVTPATIAATPVANNENENVQEPDLELLAVLLKNPDLVFALTSGQVGNLSSADTVKLLDIIKSTGGELSRLNGFKEQPTSLPSPTPHSLPSPTPTSFPSPTPSSERVMDGWRSEVGKNPFPQPVPASGEAYILPPSEHPSQTINLTPQLTDFQSQATSFTGRQQNEGLWVNNIESNPSGLSHYSNSVHVNHSPAAFSPPQQNFMGASYPPMQPEAVHYGQMQEPLHYGQMQPPKPAPISIVMNYPDGTPATLPPLMQSQHSSPFPDNSFAQPMHPPPMQWNAASSSNRYNQMGGTRGERQWRYEPSGSNHWPHPNQDNYNSFPEEQMHPLPPDGASWERDEFVDAPEYDMYSPAGVHQRSRSPEFRSGRNYSEPRRGRGRNSRNDWSRRRDSGRRGRKQENRRWRDRRY